MEKIFEQIKQTLTKWLLYYMKSMAEADRQEMHIFYHGHVEALRDMLEEITEIEVKCEKEAE